MKISDFEDRGPEFRPEDFFVGRLEGWGVLETPLGGLQQRYTISAEGTLHPDGATIRFTETWRFEDGHLDTLVWTIRPTEDGTYEGDEARLDGKADGEVAGFAFHWRYTRETPQANGKTLKLNFDDWFYRIDAQTVIVRGTASRLGVPFATAHVTYRHLG